VAAYTISASEVAKHAINVAAATEDTVTITGDPRSITVLVRSGSSPVFFSVDGSAAVVDGPRTYMAPVGAATTVDMPGDSAASTVRLISAAAAVVDVERVR
jgi:hypothetical protein